MSTPSTPPAIPGTPPSARPKAQKTTTQKKKGKGLGCCLGIAAGCGGVMLLVFLALVGAAWWGFSPGEQFDPLLLVGDDAVGAVHTSDLADDEGVKQLAVHLLDTVQELQAERRKGQDMPDWLRRLQDLQVANRANAQPEQFLPRAATVVLLEVADRDAPGFVAGVNMRQMPRGIFLVMVMAMKSDPGYQSFDASGHKVHVVDSGLAFARVGGTLLIASTGDVMARGLSRLAAGEMSATGRGLALALDEGDGDFSAFATSPALLARFARGLGAPGESTAPEGVERLDWVADLATSDELSGRFTIQAADTEAAERIAGWLERGAGDLRARAELHSLRVELARIEQRGGDAVDAEIRVSGLEAAIVERLQDAIDDAKAE